MAIGTRRLTRSTQWAWLQDSRGKSGFRADAIIVGTAEKRAVDVTVTVIFGTPLCTLRKQLFSIATSPDTLLQQKRDYNSERSQPPNHSPATPSEPHSQVVLCCGRWTSGSDSTSNKQEAGVSLPPESTQKTQQVFRNASSRSVGATQNAWACGS
ncbi:hypothetical protein BD289DRAFT_265241 [Coniella lustricola]|uniref:Uncharacterized protein n=1 Tax=Coniella lustricola TaxID=2025994 RepID=A0A2T3A7E8_9PEZI|nr:hypothetical protein BD289DRAFT_265241 [Coniella lustricola]